MTLSQLFDVLKGGPGSGNWGHVGRQGKRGGSSSRSLGVAHDYKARQSVAKGISQVLKHGLTTGNEAIVGYDSEGKAIDGMPTGNKDSVSAEAVLNRDTYVTVHNHPTSSSFSGADISSLIGSSSQHMIVIGHDGTVYKLSKPKDWLIPSEVTYRELNEGLDNIVII